MSTDTKTLELVGTIREIYRYPVKSMAGEALAVAPIDWRGIDGDRRFAFRRLGDPSGFPWLNAAKLPELVRYVALHQPAAEGRRRVRVLTPSGRDLAGDSVELRDEIAAAHGGLVEFMHLDRGVHDEAPLSLISTATVRRLCETAGAPLDVRRFRPNLFIETVANQPFAEDEWVGRRLSLGGRRESAVIAVTQRDLRCVMVNLDPDTARADPRFLKATAQLNDVCAGVYAVPLRTGTVSAGDRVYALTA